MISVNAILRRTKALRPSLYSMLSTTRAAVLPEKRSHIDILTQLDISLRKPAVANADEVIGNLSELNDSNLIVPQAFYLDALRLMTSRKDAIRTELLLRMAQKNLSIGVANESSNAIHNTRSRPVVDAFNKLVSFAVTGLLRQGYNDEAMTLLVRMSNIGYMTSRLSLIKMLDRIASSGQPSIDITLIEKIHTMVKSNRWDSSPGYHSSLLKVWRSYVAWSCSDTKSVAAGVGRVEAIFAESRAMGSATQSDSKNPLAPISTELLALLVQVYVSAALHTSSVGTPYANDLRAKAIAAFIQLIASEKVTGRSENRTSIRSPVGEKHRESDRVDALVRREVEALLGIAADSDHCCSLFNPERSASSGASIPSTATAAFHPPLNDAWVRQAGTVRAAAKEVIGMLAMQGDFDECAEILEAYLEAGSGGMGSRGRGSGSSTDKLQFLLSSKTHSSPLHAHSVLASRLSSSAWTASDVDWAREVIEHAIISSMEYFRMQNHRESEKSQSGKRIPVSGIIVTGVTEWANVLKSVGEKHGIVFGVEFYAMQIRTLAESSENTASSALSTGTPHTGTPSTGTPSTSNPQLWQRSYRKALTILDSLPDLYRDSPLITHAIVDHLCTYPSRDALAEAWRVVQDGFREKITVRGDSLARYLDACVGVLDDAELEGVLAKLDDLGTVTTTSASSATPTSASPHTGTQKHSPISPLNLPLLHARLKAHCRLGHGHKALLLLRSIRSAQHTSGRFPISRHTYTWIMHSLYYTWPGTTTEWRLATDPLSTAEYILREMGRDGHDCTPSTLASLLKLFSKAAQIAGRRTGEGAKVGGMVTAAESFLKSFSPSPTHAATAPVQRVSRRHQTGHPFVRPSPACIRELVKAACLAKMEERAHSILDTSLETYGVEPTSLCYEPLVHYYCLAGAITAAEDLITMLTNKNCPLTEHIVDSLCKGYSEKDPADALDRMQEVFNQHSTRPSPGTLLGLLDTSLENGDIHEAQRVVDSIRVMYKQDEREHCKVFVPTTARELGDRYFQAMRDEGLKSPSAPPAVFTATSTNTVSSITPTPPSLRAPKRIDIPLTDKYRVVGQIHSSTSGSAGSSYSGIAIHAALSEAALRAKFSAVGLAMV